MSDEMGHPVTRAELREELAKHPTRAELREELANFATKAELREELAKHPTKAELREELANFATKAELREELANFATKADLANFATKADLANFATKADLENFVTKADLANYPTKEYVDAFARTFLAEMQRMEQRLGKLIGEEVARHTQASAESLRSEMRAMMDPHRDHPQRIERLERAVFPDDGSGVRAKARVRRRTSKR